MRVHSDKAVLIRLYRSLNVDLIALDPGFASLIRRVFTGSAARRGLRDATYEVLIFCR